MRNIILLAALALAACGDGGAETNNVRAIRVTGTVDSDAQLKGMSELNRGLGLRRAIVDNRRRCKRVEQSGYQQPYKNMSMWTVRCSDSGDWAVFIAPNDDVQVRRCSEAKQLKLPECRFAEAPAKAG